MADRIGLLAPWQYDPQSRDFATEMGSLIGGLGLGVTPATAQAGSLIRGVMDLASAPGVNTGTGLAAADRQANYVVLQAALDYAAANGLGVTAWQVPQAAISFEYDGGRVDPNDGATNVGLQFRNGIANIDLTGCVLKQWNASHPAATLGEGGAVVTRNLTAQNVTVQNMVNGDANSRGVLYGNMSTCFLRNITVLRTAQAVMPYIGLSFFGTAGFFSNTIINQRIGAGQVNIAAYNVVTGTGNKFINTYHGGGGSTGSSGGPGVTCTGPAVIASTAGDQNTFDNFNVEWVASNQFLAITNSFGFSFNGVHFEGCQPTGSNPVGINVYGRSHHVCRSVDFLNTDLRAATGYAGTFSFVKSGANAYGSSSIGIDGLLIEQKITSGYGAVDQATYLYSENHQTGAANRVKIEQVIVNSANMTTSVAPLSIDASLPAATFGLFSKIGEYHYRYGRSYTIEATLEAGAGTDFTLYGVHRDARVSWTGPLTAARNVLVSGFLAPSGFGSTQPRLSNDQIQVGRSTAATGAFAINLRNIGNTATVASCAAAGSECFGLYNGTDVVTA